jgi:acetylornithine deacetylase/succinyl-diaminopimelate desuccinylase-like protein
MRELNFEELKQSISAWGKISETAAKELNLSSDAISEIEQEVITICRELIQIPSVNYGEGKGDEVAVAEYVARKLNEVGIESDIFVSGEKRRNVVAKIPGQDQSRPGLVLHGHIDVVPANAADWSVDPFAAEIKDGYIWGRGAVDMKDVDAMILAVVRYWARNKILPPRNILLIFFGDEEAGSEFGSHWLVDNHPELFKGYDEAVSEVGGFSINLSNGKRLYLIETAQKGIQWVKLTAKGTAGHGSFVNRDNALTKLSAAINRVGNYIWPQRVTKTGSVFWQKVAENLDLPYNPEDVSNLIPHIGPAAKMLGATVANSANPTMLEAGYKANVIPQSASAVVDGRFLPAYEEEFRSTLKELVGEDIEIEVLVRDISLEVEFAGTLVEAMCNAITAFDPEGIPVPYLMSGGTDNKALAPLGIKGYGFGPLLLPAELDFFALFHGVDERIPISGLIFGVHAMQKFLREI